MATPGGPPPVVPQGWQANWSTQYNQWFYVNATTGASQWENPSGPAYASQPAATPQPGYYPPAQPQYPQQGFALPQTAAQPAAPANTGIMGKLSNLDPKAQTALAVGGGLAAGALLEHEVKEFTTPHYPHHGGHHHVLGTMAGLMGAAGAGALGAKLFGGMGQSAQGAPPPPAPQGYPAQAPGAPGYPASPPIAPGYPAAPLGAPAYPAQAPPPSGYPGQPAPPPPGAPGSGPGLGGLGKFAMGGAAGMAGALVASEASNLLHHHRSQDGASTAVGGGGGISSFLGGITHTGPRLYIHVAAFADRDVTDKVRALVTPQQEFTLEGGKMKDEFGDPWPEVGRKMFSIMYQYGDRPLEVWAGSTSDKVEIRHEALANVRMAYINKDPGRIICLIWGSQSVLSKERVEKLDKDGELDCSGLGDGGFWPWEPRCLICYYRTPNGGVGIGHGREGGTLRLPWNPLAKWS